MLGTSAETTSNNTTQQSQFLAEQKEIVQQQTVTFIEDGDVVIEDNFTPVSPDFLKVGEDSLENSVKNFLERPVVVQEFQWNPSNPSLYEFFDLSFPGTLLSRVMVQQKIAGFRYFRADLVLRLQVNAQPFNAGRSILWWEPFGNSQSVTPSNVRHFGGITGYRHVDLDLSKSTAVELRVPYMSPLAYTDLITGFGEMGMAHLCVYSPLTGGDYVECTLWAHFENVRLEMPTGVPPHVYTTTSLRLKAQSKSVLLDKKKETKKAKGDWQTMFDSQKACADSMKGIPVIGEVASGISWFANAASSIAGIFGWSRPTNPDFETPVSNRFLRNFANFNGNTLSKPLSLDARNEIMIPKGFVDSESDEMCFNHVLKQPVYMDRFEWTTGEAAGSLLWSWPVTPASCLTTFSLGVATRYNTLLSFTSDCFELWRGGINYHFKVVKTPFHSGRLRFLFAPGADSSTNVSTLDFDKCFSQIVDLRDNIEFDFTIPFVSNTLWNMIADKPAFADGDLSRGAPTGMLYVQVLNTLKAAGQADPQIEVLIETSCADDFQFARLYLNGTVPKENFPPGEQTVISSNVSRKSLKAQIMFFPSTEVSGVDANLVSTGEVVTSFRQCLKRYTQMSNSPTGAITAPVTSKIVFPYSTSGNDPTVTDLFSYVSHVYRTMSGSMRLIFVPTETTGKIFNFNLVYPTFLTTSLPWNSDVSSDISKDFTSSRATGKFFPSEELVEFDVPWYQQMPILPTAVGLPVGRRFNDDTPSKIPQNRGSGVELYDSSFTVNRSIGEDFNFSYLIGPPVSDFTNP